MNREESWEIMQKSRNHSKITQCIKIITQPIEKFTQPVTRSRNLSHFLSKGIRIANELQVLATELWVNRVTKK